jgi:hypothetical protein
VDRCFAQKKNLHICITGLIKLTGGGANSAQDAEGRREIQCVMWVLLTARRLMLVAILITSRLVRYPIAARERHREMASRIGDCFSR